MKLLQNRALAVLLTATLVFGSTLANVNRSLNTLNRRYEEALASAESAELIASGCEKNAVLLLSVLNTAPALLRECEELRQSIESLRTITDPAELSVAAEELLRMAEELAERFEDLPGTTEREEENAEYYCELLEDCCEVLTDSELSETLRDCREGWSSPVVRVLEPLLRVERPRGV